MINHPFSKMLTSLLGSEDGELHFAFLLSHTLTNDQAPTLENTKALNTKDSAFKKAYLCEHFSKIEEVLKIVSIIIDSKDKSLLFPYMRQYMKLTGKRFSFWTYLPNKQSFLSHPAAFGNDDFSLSIIDPFRGNQPLLLNNETVTADKWDISYQVQIILDSQILNYVDWYISDPGKLPGDRLVYVRRLLQYLATNKYFYSPFFYYFESMSKGSNESQLRRTFELIARMHCMDTEAMLRDGSFCFDDRRFSELRSAFNATTFDDLVDSEMTSAREFSGIMSEQIKLIDIIYCIIIKTVLIEKSQPRLSLRQKFDMIQEFLENVIQARFSYEIVAAFCYFAGKLQNFFRVQTTMRHDKAKQILRSCAWDLLLLRQPDFFLAFGSPEHTVISSICSNDRALRDIAGIYRLASLLRFIDDDVILPMHKLDETYMTQLVGSDEFSRTTDTLGLEERISLFGKNKEKKISVESVASLKHDLEGDLSRITC
ncbi:MAG: hypothetical protein NTX75_18405 [Proteobacteria bacterium]|nr:hypothetical protein [Pseudomonadota bacterium]